MRHLPSAFLGIGIAFVAIGLVRQRAFIAVGIVFIVLALVRWRSTRF